MRSPGSGDGLAKQSDREGGRGLPRDDADRQHPSGERIDDGPDADGSEEAANPREVEEPDIAGPSGAKRAAAGLAVPGAPREPAGRSAQDPLDAGPGRLETQPCEDPRHAPRAPSRPLALEQVGQLRDKVGEGVPGAPPPDEPGLAPGDVLPPVHDGLHRDDEDPRRRADREPVARLVPEDAQTLEGLVAGATAGIEPAEPGPEEVVLLAESCEGLAEDIDLRAQGMAPGDLDAPEVVRGGDPSRDEEEGSGHGPRRVARGVLAGGSTLRELYRSYTSRLCPARAMRTTRVETFTS